MCGIAGYVTSRQPAAEAAVGAMMDRMARRGPDSQGRCAWPGAVLGHRRLAILDLSPAGHQPMLSDDGAIGVTFNGCIYNFVELRRELESLGHRFRSQCDTEVLVRGYQQWGIDDLVRRLRGMFAFGIWDDRRRTLTLARDRLGVKPLVWCAAGGGIAFASTISALRTAGFGGDIDPQAVLDVLEWGFVTEERSIYDGMRKLPPAGILEWRDGEIRQRQYWEVPAAGAVRIPFEEAVEETERLLVEAVRLRLVADVPIGVLLSGGVDSGLICWAMRQLNADATAYTVRAPKDPADESEGAARTAQALGIRHEIVDMPAMEFSLDTLVDAYSEPFPCESGQAMLWVSEAVARRATVLLTGDGGDDVYLGYPCFQHALLAERLARRLPPAAGPAWRALRGALPAIGPVRRARNFLNYATEGIGAYVRANDGVPYLAQHRVLGDRLEGRPIAERMIPVSRTSATHLLSEVLRYNKRMHFTAEFLPKVDGATMYFGLEARAPFMDQKLWEFAAALPPEHHLRGGALKAILREVMRRRIGPEMAARKKQGFTVPVERWLAGRWSPLLDTLRGGTALERDGWIRRGALEAPLQAAMRDRLVPVQLWRLLVLEHWLQRQPAPSAAYACH